MLRVDSLSLSYGRALALDRIDLEVASGEVVSMIGPNGAGKTSLLRGLSGLEPVRGAVVFEGARIDNLPPHRIVRRGLIHCPQSAQLFPEMSVEDNLRLGRFAVGEPANAKRTRDFVLELFPPLVERRDQEAGTLSGGERQMVAIGHALMAEPRLLMLDEPSLGLAPVVRDRIEDAIRQIVGELTLTVLLVEQDTSLAMDIADRVYILDSGRVVKVGTPADIAGDSAIQEAYLGVARAGDEPMSRDTLKDRLAQTELRALPEDQLRSLEPAFPAIEDMRARVRRRPHDNTAPLPPASPAW